MFELDDHLHADPATDPPGADVGDETTAAATARPGAADAPAATAGPVAGDPGPGSAAPGDGVAQPSPALPAPSAAGAPRRGRADLRAIVAASLLSAAMASGTTAALVARTATTSTSAPTTTATSSTAISGITTAAATSSSLASVAAAAAPAVVTIDTTVTGQGFGPRGAVGGSGVGSGFIYDAGGYILTAAHVVEGASRISVTLHDGRTFDATVVRSDTTHDVAVLKIAATGLPTIPLGTSASLSVAQTVITIGDPLGSYPGTVTVGIVSGLDRSLTVADDLTGQARDLTGMVQTDAAINPGNSGGPLIDTSGRAVGVISAAASSAEGIGFAVPIDVARTVVAAAAA